MQNVILLTDGSVQARSKNGYGAYLAVPDAGLPLEELESHVQVRRFEQTSSTRLELQTLLWARQELQPLAGKGIIYTDSQNIVGLPGRRERLEHRAYLSSKNRLLKNHDLYREFFRLADLCNYELVKVRGHVASRQRDDIDRLFSLVDRASRNAARRDLE